MLVATIQEDDTAIGESQERFDRARSARLSDGAGECPGFTGAELRGLLRKVRTALGSSPVLDVRKTAEGEAGDVLVTRKGGAVQRIEIKAQLTRPAFKCLQNTDCVRGGTDFLHAFITKERSSVIRRLGSEAQEWFRDYRAIPRWDLGALWVSDIAGVTTANLKAKFGLAKPADLMPFLAQKYFLHVTMEGLRVFRLSEVPNLRSALRGGLSYRIRPRTDKCDLAIWTRGDGGVPARGAIHFTYYFGQRRLDLGGHHMQEPLFAGAAPLVLARPSSRGSGSR